MLAGLPTAAIRAKVYDPTEPRSTQTFKLIGAKGVIGKAFRISTQFRWLRRLYRLRYLRTAVRPKIKPTRHAGVNMEPQFDLVPEAENFKFFLVCRGDPNKIAATLFRGTCCAVRSLSSPVLAPVAARPLYQAADADCRGSSADW